MLVNNNHGRRFCILVAVHRRFVVISACFSQSVTPRSLRFGKRVTRLSVSSASAQVGYFDNSRLRLRIKRISELNIILWYTCNSVLGLVGHVKLVKLTIASEKVLLQRRCQVIIDYYSIYTYGIL